MNSSQENKFKCECCGECCKVFRMPILNRDEIIKSFETDFGFKLKTYKLEMTLHGECEHLVNNKCSIYENRFGVCKEFSCRRHTSLDVPAGQIYQKRCLVCGEMRKFQKGTERDKQGVCGNCWNW